MLAERADLSTRRAVSERGTHAIVGAPFLYEYEAITVHREQRVSRDDERPAPDRDLATVEFARIMLTASPVELTSSFQPPSNCSGGSMARALLHRYAPRASNPRGRNFCAIWALLIAEGPASPAGRGRIEHGWMTT